MSRNGPRTKERDLSKIVEYPQIYYKSKSGFVPLPGNSPSTRTWKGRQVTVSEGHRRNKRGVYDSGGPFFTARVANDIGSRTLLLEEQNVPEARKYSGPVTLPVPNSDYSGLAFPSQDDSHLDYWGTQAIHAVDPTDPNANTGVALGEIFHDRSVPIAGIPTWERRTQAAKAAGSEYLNAVFGWMPLVRDMKSTAQSVKDGNEIIKNYRAASGTLVHREFEFPVEESDEEVLVQSGTRCRYSGTTNISGFNSTPVPLFRRSFIKIRRWFSGSFTYYASQAKPLDECMAVDAEADKLYALQLTPEVVWELAPWSWAIDWFSNAGSVISNTEAFKAAGLVMKYGYIMEEYSRQDYYFMPDTGLIVHGAAPRGSVELTVKRRREANPFGFGVSWDGLSPTQLTIAAALGITRL